MYCTTCDRVSKALPNTTITDETTYVVAIWVLNQSQRIVRDFIHELHALLVRRMVDAPLQDTAPVTVGRDLDAVGSYSIVDELSNRGSKPYFIDATEPSG